MVGPRAVIRITIATSATSTVIVIIIIIIAVITVPGPAISFLIRLSFVDGVGGGAVSAPVFWDMNGLTLRGGEMARVCFVAGELG